MARLQLDGERSWRGGSHILGREVEAPEGIVQEKILLPLGPWGLGSWSLSFLSLNILTRKMPNESALARFYSRYL